jgi:amino-acid N-acetyltransferase
VPFFEKLGFTVTSKAHFPDKVWRDCAICPMRLACDETAVVKSIE